MTIAILQGALELGLIYSFVTLGIFISYRVLDIPDLTTDGSFTLGASVCAVFTVMGYPILGIIFAAIAGILAGIVTATLHTRLKIQPILAGIITMTALYSVNLRVMGKSNIPLIRIDTIFTYAKNVFPQSVYKLIPILLIVIVVFVFVHFFLKTNLGLSIRATGDNKAMVSSSSINPNKTTTIGLGMANGFVAMGGALLCQYQQFSDLSMGIGMVVIALASLIIGEVVLTRKSMLRNIIAVIVGSIVYRLVIALALQTSVKQSDLKALSALIVAIAISYPAIKEKISIYRKKKAGKKDA